MNSKAYSWIGAVIGSAIGLLMAGLLKISEGESLLLLLNLIAFNMGFGAILYKIIAPKRKSGDIFLPNETMVVIMVIGGLLNGFVFGIGGGNALMSSWAGAIFGFFSSMILGYIYAGVGGAIVTFIFPGLINAAIGGLVGGIVGAIVAQINIFGVYPAETPMFVILIFAVIGYKVGNPLGTWIENKWQKRQRLAEEQRRKEEARLEAERREQERRERERRKAEEERRRREEEERSRLEGMKREIIEKIDEAVREDEK